MGARQVTMLLLWLGLVAPPALADAPGAASGQFEASTLPLIKQYCLECHSAEEQEGDLDLERFTTIDQARNAPRVWQRVAEVLELGEMPPKEARQPDRAERDRLRDWTRSFLAAEAGRRAGDPGRVVLRRLNNAEYTHTLRDLTEVEALDPAREFPVDGAAGEGFTNTGNALVMSPSLLTKYLDAAKGVAAHAVLLPDGFRFSPGTTPRDWTEETLAKIRALYRESTDAGSGGDRVNLQGIVFDTNQGGRLPVERYLAATVAERAGIASGTRSIEAVAKERGLNPRYLGTLWKALVDPKPTLLIGVIQAHWRTARPEDVAALSAEVAAWQQSLWKFSSVGHIGKQDGPKAWMEPSSPMVASREVRFKIPPAPGGGDVTLSLVVGDAGDGDAGDLAAWRNPRLIAPGRPDLPLKDLRRVAGELASRRERLFADTASYLGAAAEAERADAPVDVPALARSRGLDPEALRAWLDYLGLAPGGAVSPTGLFEAKLIAGGGHAFVNGWGSNETPQLLANSSDQLVRVPGDLKPHGVAVHPSATLRAGVGWRSPATADFRVEAKVRHAHALCGNGIAWSLELRRGTSRRKLAEGLSQGGKEIPVGPVEGLSLHAGDLISLLIGSRDGYHACDLTAVDLTLTEAGPSGRSWDLAADVSGDVLAANPHADRLGNPGVWHFYAEPDRAGEGASPFVPAGSILARWQASKDAAGREKLAEGVRALLAPGEAPTADGPDSALRRRLRSPGGPLLGPILRSEPGSIAASPAVDSPWGLDPSAFGKHPDGHAIEPNSLGVRAPSAVTFRVPAELAEGAELAATGSLVDPANAEGSVQFEVVAGPPPRKVGLAPIGATVTLESRAWSADNRPMAHDSPIVANEGSAARARIEAAFADFRNLFPAALCYAKIVPVDEVVTLTLFHREDHHLARLMLDDAGRAKLDRLWGELHFEARDPLTLVDAFAQLLEYASQDGDPKVFEPLRQPIKDRAAAFRLRLVEAEPRQVDALLAFAARAYRRPLKGPESAQLRDLYASLRAQGLAHDEAFRLTLARVLVAPSFLYRAETPGPGPGQGPVSGTELATRLGYFLWSSSPDAELTGLAESGKLADPEVVAGQAARMLRDPRVRRLATEFAAQWLHVSGFDRLDEKSERHFPTFLGLRSAMDEETVRFFTDLFQRDGSVLEILDADHTFLNEALAAHYGIPFPKGEGWRRVDGVKRYGRGGILGLATTLATQSGASRTSPTLRGNWISEVLLGERLPRPPKGVPQLPDDEAATAGLTVRQLVEKHASDAKCAVCHDRIDPLGFSLEGYDAIGRLRTRDLGDRPIDTRSKARDGAEFDGLDGLRSYLLTARRDAFLDQFCRKLLGFALGRSTQLSDAPVLAEMRAAFAANNYRIGPAIGVIVRSRPFREIRGSESAYTD